MNLLIEEPAVLLAVVIVPGSTAFQSSEVTTAACSLISKLGGINKRPSFVLPSSELIAVKTSAICLVAIDAPTKGSIVL